MSAGGAPRIPCENFCAFQVFQRAARFGGADRRNAQRHVGENLDEHAAETHDQRGPQLLVTGDRPANTRRL